MSFKESLQNLIKPKEVKEAEEALEFSNALIRERQATASYLSGEISPEQYDQIFKETTPITGINLRELASELKRISKR